jgi:Spy/CpxP family protein refolding chaperone
VRPLRFSVALQLFVVFASGALVGGLAYRLYTSHPEAPTVMKAPPRLPGRGGGPSFRDRYVGEMRERLKLREDQIQKLNEILEVTGRGFREAKRRSDVEMRTLQENQQAQIRAMLEPPQIAEFEKMLQEREEQMKRNRSRGRGPRP